MPPIPRPQEKPPGTSLSDVAFLARQAVKFGAVGIVVLIIGRVVLNASITIWKSLNPPKPLPPTVGFGLLPSIRFPLSDYTVDSYRLETRTGSLPNLGLDQLPVFFIPPQTVSLLSLERAKSQAAALGFTFTPEEISPTVYRWRKNTPIPSTLDIEIDTQAFTLSTSWAASPEIITRITPQQAQQYGGTARSLLAQADLLLPDLATGEARTTYLRSAGPEMVPAQSVSEAEFVRVDIFRRLFNSRFPVLRESPALGNARFIFGSNVSRASITIEGSYRAAPIDYSRFETYPIITPQEAWQLMSTGEGFVAMVDQGVRDVVVRDVYLAFFDSSDPQDFLQPIYVFTGDRNFFGYVPAVNPQYLE